MKDQYVNIKPLHSNHDQNTQNPVYGKQTGYNKNAINFLKQEITTIRQGMTKLLRAKSSENIKISDLNLINKPELKQTVSNYEPRRPQQSTESRNQLQVLQLKARVRELEQENADLTNRLNKVQKELDLKTVSLTNHIKQLENQMYTLELDYHGISNILQRKFNMLVHQRPIVRNVSTQLSNPPQHHLNPQLKQKQRNYVSESIIREVNFLKGMMHQIGVQNHNKSFSLNNMSKVIAQLNNKIIRLESQKLALKFTQCKIQQQQNDQQH